MGGTCTTSGWPAAHFSSEERRKSLEEDRHLSDGPVVAGDWLERVFVDDPGPRLFETHGPPGGQDPCEDLLPPLPVFGPGQLGDPPPAQFIDPESEFGGRASVYFEDQSLWIDQDHVIGGDLEERADAGGALPDGRLSRPPAR